MIEYRITREGIAVLAYESAKRGLCRAPLLLLYDREARAKLAYRFGGRPFAKGGRLLPYVTVIHRSPIQ